MSDLLRSDRKRNQTDFLGATETVAKDTGKTRAGQGRARRARATAIAAAYEPLGGLVQLGEAGGGEGSVWVGAEDSPALGGFAPTPADRQRFALREVGVTIIWLPHCAAAIRVYLSVLALLHL
jgi:hypothetical protein